MRTFNDSAYSIAIVGIATPSRRRSLTYNSLLDNRELGPPSPMRWTVPAECGHRPEKAMRLTKALLILGAATLMQVMVSISAAAQNFPPAHRSNRAFPIDGAFEAHNTPPDERACAGAGGIVLVNAVCFPLKACATIDVHNVERVACLMSETAQDLEIQRSVVTRRASKKRQDKR